MSTARFEPRSAERPLAVRSVVGLAYDEIRALIVAGDLASGGRLAQAELAERLGVSLTSVREALRRLAGDGLVEFEVNRGFFVAELGLESVVQRLEARLVLEPAVARLAAERRTEADLAGLRKAIADERAARSSAAAHDASRAFHVGVAAATGNEAFTKLLDALWMADIGRQLLARRRLAGGWQERDADDHAAILAALESRDGELAAALMATHVREAIEHWTPRAASGQNP